MASFEFPLQIKRQYDAPLDYHSVLTTSERVTWLTDARRYAGQVVYDSLQNKLYMLDLAKTNWFEIPVSIRSYNDTLTADEFYSTTLSGRDMDLSGNLRVAGTMSITSGVSFAGNTTMTGDLTVNGNTTLGSDANDTVTINAGPVILASAIAAADALQFGSGANLANLYRSANDTLKTDDSFIVGTNLTVDGTSTFTGTFTVNSTTITLGDANTDTVTINAGPITLTYATAAADALEFGSGANLANLYRSANDTLRTDDSFIVGTNLTVVGTITLANQTANTVFAGPTTGGAATPGFRALVAADIPTLDIATKTSGTLAIARGGTNSTSFTTNTVLVFNGTSIASSTITTTELGYLDNVTSDVQTQINNLKDAFNYAATTGVPTVYVRTLSGITGATEYALLANSTYELTYSIQSLNTNTPVAVISSNRDFDYINPNIGQPNNFLPLRSVVDLASDAGTTGYTAINPRFIITKTNNTTILVGLTGMTNNPGDVGSTADSIYRGSFVRVRKIS